MRRSSRATSAAHTVQLVGVQTQLLDALALLRRQVRHSLQHLRHVPTAVVAAELGARTVSSSATKKGARTFLPLADSVAMADKRRAHAP